MEAGTHTIDWLTISLKMIGGLVLFIYSITLLSEGLKAISGDKVKSTLAKFTTNRYTGIASGTAATAIVGSSSVTIITVIALVNAGLLTFTQSLGVVMGSNIGTTVSSQIFALDVEKYAPVVLLTGLLLKSLSQSARWKNIGLITFALGLVFFSLGFMGDTMSPLKSYPAFTGLIKDLESPWIGVMVGAGLTALIQSSSATMGIVIVLASQGMMTLSAGIAVMLGAEIGTCADTLIASIGRDRGAVRTGIFHLFFNTITVIVGVSTIEYIISFAQWVSPGASLERQVANAHVFFNLAGVLLLVGFTRTIAQFLCWLIPQRRTTEQALA